MISSSSCSSALAGALANGMRCLLLLALSTASVPAQSLVLSEIMAANNSGLRDEDGDFSDWIEVYNTDRTPADLAGWHLTDDPQDLTKWTFPNATIPGQGFVIVFASGKDRNAAAGEWHSNFNLNRDGEYLALVRPDGVTIASAFTPAFPRQLGDVSYGRSMQEQTQTYVPSSAWARAHVPADDAFGSSWTLPGFDDSNWTPVLLGVGYDRPTGPTNVVTIEPEDVTQPGDEIVPTSFNSPGNEGAENAIDDTTSTKYLNFDKLNAGITITPSAGDTVVVGLRFSSANDAPERDPTSFVLSGSRDGAVFTEIAQGAIPNFPARFYTVEVAFLNEAAYLHYRLIFPTVRNAATANSVQISEIELLGYVGAPPPDFTELIRTDVESQLFDQGTSVYLRIPFVAEPGQPVEWLALWSRYDDGFAALINGTEVARANAPDTLVWNSAALTDRTRLDVLQEVRFDLSGAANALVTGTNLLAVQGLNDRADSPDFLIDLRLENTELTLGSAGYMSAPSPGRQNGEVDIGLVADPETGTDRGFYDAPVEVVLTCPTEGAFVRFTTDGSTPSLTNGSTYTGPILIQQTTTLRAAAFLSGWRPSQVVTHTYLFLNDIVLQDQANTLAAGFPAFWDTQTADYGLDPRVVGQDGQDQYGGKYTAALRADLLALPSMSLVMELDDLFGDAGIYSHPTSRGAAWERPASLELIYPDGRPGFHVNAGIRIQGGAFRRFDLTLKKSFRVVFRESYGPGRLHFPLFGPDAADEFNNFVLRANSNDAWPYNGGGATYIRDSFATESMRAMGHVSSHADFVHLYINGRYWGLYNPIERPDAVFSATYHGGNEDNWDAINQDSAPDGNYDAWNRLLAASNEDWSDNAVYQRVQGNDPDGTRNPAYEVLLDVDNMIDYMILNFYIGNTDWPGRNYWVGRDRTGEQGFQFYPWDSETALSGLNTDRTGVNSAVARPYAAARANAEFRVRFGDRVYRHFFNGGAFYVDSTASGWDPAQPNRNLPAARWAALVEGVRPGVVGESARWGDQLRATPYTRDEHWQSAVNGLLSNYFPGRSASVLNILRNAGLYPNVDAPQFNQEGGSTTNGFQLVMTAPQGTIYYTTDGTDPRTPIELEVLNQSTPVDSNTAKRVLVPSTANGGDSLGDTWRAVGFDDSAWVTGTGGVGYDTTPNYLPLIGISVDATMRNQNGSVFIRVPFNLPSTNQLNHLVLRMRVDDGFAAFLNGQPIASANAPTTLQWNSFASAGATDSVAVQFRDYDVSDSVSTLRAGANVLAIHGLNISLGSSDFLIDAELEVSERRIVGGTPTAPAYTGPISLGDGAQVKARVLDGAEWSALHEATFILGVPDLAISELNYHPIDPSPDEIAAGYTNENEFEFVELFNPGTGIFDLTGVQFVDGITFDFSESTIAQLPPGGYLLVVRNQSAFEFRYGTGLPIAGQYTDRLSNAGERVALANAAGELLAELDYGTLDPWPATPDGLGRTLELRDATGNRGAPDHWQASGGWGGSPGLPPASEFAPLLGFSRDRGELRLRVDPLAMATCHILSADRLDAGVIWRHERALDLGPAEGPRDIVIELRSDLLIRFFKTVLTSP